MVHDWTDKVMLRMRKELGDAGRESRKDGRRPATVDPHVSSGKFVDENRILRRLALKNRRPRRP